MRWMCTQDNWKSERSSVAAYCHHRPSHLFAAAPESVYGGWNLEWMQPVKLLEDYQLFIYVFRFVPVAQFTDDLHDRQSQKQYKVSAYLFIHLPLFVCPPPLSVVSQRRPASVFAVPPWSTRCLLRSWATSCRVVPEAATWPGTTAEVRKRTRGRSNCCSSLARKGSRYMDKEPERRGAVAWCIQLSNVF